LWIAFNICCFLLMNTLPAPPCLLPANAPLLALALLLLRTNGLALLLPLLCCDAAAR
jgi:hypothetical protein